MYPLQRIVLVSSQLCIWVASLCACGLEEGGSLLFYVGTMSEPPVQALCSSGEKTRLSLSLRMGVFIIWILSLSFPTPRMMLMKISSNAPAEQMPALSCGSLQHTALVLWFIKTLWFVVNLIKSSLNECQTSVEESVCLEQDSNTQQRILRLSSKLLRQLLISLWKTGTYLITVARDSKTAKTSINFFNRYLIFANFDNELRDLPSLKSNIIHYSLQLIYSSCFVSL